MNCYKKQPIQNFLSNSGIKWKFIVERPTWWGGFWEYLVRTIKNALMVTIGKARLTWQQLRTVIVETESIVNLLLFTYLSADPLSLWIRWSTECMQLLQSFHHAKCRVTEGLKRGDVFLVFDQSKPRIHWKMAIIKKPFPGRNGKVRA